MYQTKTRTTSRLLAIAMALAMVLTLTVSAFASTVQPAYVEETSISATVNATSKTYTVTVQAPSGTSKVKFDATLYQKKLVGRTEISSVSSSANGSRCAKSQSASIESGKTYVVEVTAQIYSGGTWDTIEKTITVKT